MVNSIDLAKYTESDESDDQVILINKSRKTREWAMAKSRALPSENWDDDFLFGSTSTASAESLPIHKSTSSCNLHHHLQSNPTTPKKLPLPNHPIHINTQSNTTPKAISSHRPPSSAPASRPGLTHFILDSHSSSSNHPKTTAITTTTTTTTLTARNSRPPPSFRRRPSSHVAVSSQDSVPSISDLSCSIGFRSPSSTTDDSRGNSSQSSAGFNTSFNTETDFTEPDNNDVDWPDDTDLDNRSSSHSPLMNLSFQPPSSKSLRLPRSNLKPSPPPPPHHHHQTPISGKRPSNISLNLESPPSETNTRIMTTALGPARRVISPHPSFDSQSTFTSSNSNHIDTSLDPYARSNHSNLSLHSSSSSSRLDDYESSHVMSPPIFTHNQQAHLRRLQHQQTLPLRNPSQSSSSSSQPLTAYQSSSPDSHESIIPLSSDPDARLQAYLRQPPCSPRLTTPNSLLSSSQRSRKQALYSRPAYVNHPASLGPGLAISQSSSTLSCSSISLGGSDHTTTDEGSTAVIEDDGRLKNLRRKLRKKRPSALPLTSSNNVAMSASNYNTSSSSVIRKPSAAESIYSESDLSGDLAFAADSDNDNDGSGRLKRPDERRNKKPSSPFELVEKPDFRPNTTTLRPPTSAGLKPQQSLPQPPRAGLNTRRTRASVSDCSGPPSALITAASSQSNIDKNGQQESKKKMKITRRPLSFTALLSRHSFGHNANNSTAGTLQNSKTLGHHGDFASSSGSSIVSGLFVRKSTETVRDTLAHSSLDENKRTTARSTRGHARQTASIDYGRSEGVANTESFLSRVRRLSSRRPTPPDTPTHHRLSIISTHKNDQINSHDYPSESTTTNRSNSPPVSAQAGGGRTLRSSSRGAILRGSSLRRRFSASSNDKPEVQQPPHSSVLSSAPPNPIEGHHNLPQPLGLAPPGCSSSRASTISSMRKNISGSRPPKSNPALRRKAAASVSATLEAYQSHSPSPRSTTTATVPITTKPVGDHHLRQSSDGPGPASEPIPDSVVVPTTITTAAVIGRSNSMGELRIPSRITSQQGRLQNELNQMKEFARGIDDLKSMRSHYQNLIKSSRSTISAANLAKKPSSIADITASTREACAKANNQLEGEDSEDSSQPSPNALNKLSETMTRIETEYKEWWTCCNVLIDLGEGETDPRKRFSPDRVRAFSCDPSTPTCTGNNNDNTNSNPSCADGEESRHFEILKSMFGGPVPASPGPLSAPDETFGGAKVADDRTLTIGDDGSSVIGRRLQHGKVENSPDTIRKGSRISKKKVVDRSGSETASIFTSNSISAPVSDEACSSFVSVVKTGAGMVDIIDGGRNNDNVGIGSSSSSSRGFIKGRSGFGSGVGQGRMALKGVKDFLRTLKGRMGDQQQQQQQQHQQHQTQQNSQISRSGSASSTPAGPVHNYITTPTNTLPAMRSATLAPASAAGGGANRRSVSSPSCIDSHLNLQNCPKQQSTSTASSKSGSRSSESSSEEYWDEEITNGNNGQGANYYYDRKDSLDLAVGVGTALGGTGNTTATNHHFNTRKRLALSSDRMPQLLNYLGIVRGQCSACLEELKSQTV